MMFILFTRVFCSGALYLTETLPKSKAGEAGKGGKGGTAEVQPNEQLHDLLYSAIEYLTYISKHIAKPRWYSDVIPTVFRPCSVFSQLRTPSARHSC